MTRIVEIVNDMRQANCRRSLGVNLKYDVFPRHVKVRVQARWDPWLGRLPHKHLVRIEQQGSQVIANVEFGMGWHDPMHHQGAE